MRSPSRLRFSTSIEQRDLSSGGYVAHLRFFGNRKYPILNPEAVDLLTTSFRELNEQAKLRAVFLRSTIAGADIHHMKNLKNASQAEIFIRSIDDLCSSIQSLRMPVIAFINGPCMGAGMEVAASCDMRVATDDPKTIFAMPETKIGIPSVVQASLLPRLVGWGRARQLLYFGEQMTSRAAYAAGFINELISPQALPDALARWETLVDESEAEAVATQKSLMRTWEEIGTGRAGIEASVKAFGRSFETDIPHHRMTAFLEQLKARTAQ